jgi:hypothetical protein
VARYRLPLGDRVHDRRIWEGMILHDQPICNNLVTALPTFDMRPMTSIWASVLNPTQTYSTYPITVAPFVEPEAHHIVHRFAKRRALKIEIYHQHGTLRVYVSLHAPGIFVS